jgi:hypothetical protein
LPLTPFAPINKIIVVIMAQSSGSVFSSDGLLRPRKCQLVCGHESETVDGFILAMKATMSDNPTFRKIDIEAGRSLVDVDDVLEEIPRHEL